MTREEAIKAIKAWDFLNNDEKEVIETLIPELAKSEDERIRKELIQFIENWKDPNNIGRQHDFPTLTRNVEQCDKYLAWLEKQGEQKHKIQPKFKVGDFIVNDYCMGKVIELTDDAYLLDTGQGIPFSCEHNAHLWSIEDAKDGDVLFEDKISSLPSPFIVIFKTKDSVNTFSSHCFIGFDGNFYEGEGEHYPENLHPATKEQHDLLFHKMKEAGYTFDFEKKELKKIEQKLTEDVDLLEFESYLCLMFQKFRTKGMCTNGEIIDYVKEHSQKLGDILSKPAWSEEDKRMHQYVVDDLRFVKEIANDPNYAVSVGRVEEEINWMESLKQRYTWKPSDEQINTLQDAIVYVEGCHSNFKGNGSVLEKLYVDLKKLREE